MKGLTTTHSFAADRDLTALLDRFLSEWLDPGKAHITAHTSGSTSTPKEIHLPKADMIHSARATNLRLGISEDSTLLCPLSPGYIAGKMMIVRGSEAGCRVILTAPSNRFWDDPDVSRLLSDTVVDLVAVVPSQCKVLLESEQCNIANIRNIIIGGAAIPDDMERRLLDRYGSSATRFFATYGMTETCSHVALRPLGQPFFEAMPGVTFSTDSRGCLRIEAPGYSFKSLQTNDIVKLENEVCFRWLGRFDNVINSGGIKLFPEQIERKLREHIPGDFYIIGYPDEKWGESPVLVTDIPLQQMTDTQILEICRTHLQPFECPKGVRRVAELPKASNGKLRRLRI